MNSITAPAGKVCKPLECSHCMEKLEGEDADSPFRDKNGDLYCEGCFFEEVMGDCDRCGACVDLDELAMNPGELLAFWAKTDGLEPGYYRVLRWPIYMDGMITGYVVTDNLQRFGPLDEKGLSAAKFVNTPGGRLCCACRLEIDPAKETSVVQL